MALAAMQMKPSSLHKLYNHVLIKFAVSFLLIGLAFRFFLSDPISISSSTPSPLLDATAAVTLPPAVASPPVPPPVSEDFLAYESQTAENVVTPQCDLFKGEWVPEPSGSVYTSASCPHIQGPQNCMKNGRPDSNYIYWRWNPRDCELPRFDPAKFLDLMRHKSWALIGDSISRNHVQSMLCILSQVEEAVEIYHDEEYKSRKWRFPAHNFTLAVIWSPFLLRAEIFEDLNGVSSKDIQLHLDKLDKTWTEEYENLDYVVIASGKWYLKTAIYHENGTVTGCHYCPRKNLTELGFDYAYRRAMQEVLGFIESSDHKPFVFLRTTTPDHFENGEWHNGGYCNRTVPFREGEVEMRDIDVIMRDIELEEFQKVAGSGNGTILRLLDTSWLSLLRPDGHPGPYRQFQPFAKDKNAKVQNDCLHWCLPGPIDSWNDLLLEMVVKG